MAAIPAMVVRRTASLPISRARLRFQAPGLNRSNARSTSLLCNPSPAWKVAWAVDPICSSAERATESKAAAARSTPACGRRRELICSRPKRDNDHDRRTIDLANSRTIGLLLRLTTGNPVHAPTEEGQGESAQQSLGREQVRSELDRLVPDRHQRRHTESDRRDPQRLQPPRRQRVLGLRLSLAWARARPSGGGEAIKGGGGP